jgi:hypothetical protein
MGCPCSFAEVGQRPGRRQESRGEVGCFPEDQNEDQEHCCRKWVLRSHVECQVGWQGHLHGEWEDEVPRVRTQEYYHNLGEEGLVRMGWGWSYLNIILKRLPVLFGPQKHTWLWISHYATSAWWGIGPWGWRIIHGSIYVATRKTSGCSLL